MIYRKPRVDEWEKYDSLSEHPLQSKAWGDFRESTEVDVIRLVGFDQDKMVSQMQLTFHPIPKIGMKVGYYPKGKWPDEIQLKTLIELGKQNRVIFIKLEPNVSSPPLAREKVEEFRKYLLDNGCQLGRAMFTPYSFILDISKSEEDLLKLMKSKTRYNIRVAQKHGVTVVEDSTDAGFEDYLKLLALTTKRQKFYSHDEKYHRGMWKHMKEAGIARVLKGIYQDKVIVAWVIFIYKDKLYYPYGSSSRDHRKVMASNLMMWETMRFGKRHNCKSFDMWGSLGPDPDKDDPWYGFHKFKKGYGGDLAEFAGSYDLVVDPQRYKLYRKLDRWRWKYLRFRSSLPF